MSTAPPPGPLGPGPSGLIEPIPPAPRPTPSCGRARLGAGESAVVIAAIAAVTALAALQRPVPAVLTALASAATLLLVPARVRAVLSAWAAGGSRE